MVYLIDNHASSPYHNPQSQVSIRNNPGPLSYGSLSPQRSGQYISARPGNIRGMSAAQFAFMSNKMTRMKQEMKPHFDGDNEEQNTAGPDMYNESPRHINISGNHTEVDNNHYQSDFDSNKVDNNIIENSFGEGEQGDNNVCGECLICSFVFPEQTFLPSSSTNNETEDEASSCSQETIAVQRSFIMIC